VIAGGKLAILGVAAAIGLTLAITLRDRPEPTLTRVSGRVVAGSLHSQISHQQSEHTFELDGLGGHVRVHHSGPLPDTFREGVHAAANGTFERDGDTSSLFEATDVYAKPPDDFDLPRKNDDH
jgi:cytochrome c-type biogenesis protein CcmE